MKLRNIQNGAVVTVISEDKVRKVVQVEFEADGKTKDFSMSTIKRWWREIKDDKAEEQYVQEVMEQKKELGIECPPIESYEVVDEVAGDGTPYKQVMEEILQDEKKAAKKVKKQKKESGIPLQDRLDKLVPMLTKAGFYIKRYDKQPKTIPISLDPTGKKAFCSVYLGASKCVLCVKASAVPKGYKPDRTRSCPLGAAFDIPYDNLNKVIDIITKMEKKEEK